MGTKVEQARAEALPESEVPVDAVEGFEVKEPTVCAIMPTRDRPEMSRRAVECFMAQTYERKLMFILDQGVGSDGYFGEYDGVRHQWTEDSSKEFTIGTLRNIAIERAVHGSPEIILHFDSDDWSHPNRIAEQVSLLQSSGADAVGYREMLFWKQIPGNLPHGQAEYECGCGDCRGEAWLYTNNDPRYIVGSSLCYWRAAWERQPFRDIMRGEDYEFVKGLKSVGVGSMRHTTACGATMPEANAVDYGPDLVSPRMICSIHGGNTCGYTEATLAGSINWRRVPEWDSKLREVMSL